MNVSPVAASYLINTVLQNKKFSIKKLVPTKREIELVELRSHGLSFKEIANHVFLSTKTVAAHLYNANRRLGTKNSIQAFRRMVELGYISIKVDDVPDESINQTIEALLPNIQAMVKEGLLNARNHNT